MKILHISSNDACGGAALAAYRLHRGLQRLGCASSMFVLNAITDDPSVIRFRVPMDPLSRIQRSWRRRSIASDFKPYRFSRPSGLEGFSDDRSQFGSTTIRQLPDCDILNLHWTSRFIDQPAFFGALAAHKPVVLTLHDLNAFTGGCHYDEECGKYLTWCGACPQLGSGRQNDLSRAIWLRKKRSYHSVARGNLFVVANSEWLAGLARGSALLGDLPISTVHFGLDVEEFSPKDRLTSRLRLGLPEKARIVLFVAQSASIRRKGLGLLVEVLRQLRQVIPDLLLVSVGRGRPDFGSDLQSTHVQNVPNESLPFVYSAADVFVMPSLQEAFGQTALEALSCGTPVAGFAAGGIPEIVQDGKTGLLSPVGAVDGLRDSIAHLLLNPSIAHGMSVEGRRWAVEHFSLEEQAAKYAELYDSILSRQSSLTSKRGFRELSCGS